MLRLLMAKIKHLDIEVSSTCQAACPMCARHTAGKTTIDPVNQTLADVKRTYREISKGLETITMCGNIGDTMGNKEIALICRWFIMRNPDIEITIHTNGGLGNPKTYKELALLGVRIVVAIDGMEDTNHYHRVGVKWSNLLKNLEAYQSGFENKIKVRWTEKRNNNGNVGEYGMIEIQMLIWQHNQHQVLEMADFAQQHKANLWYRRANTATSEQFNNGTPVFTVTGRWTCNIYSPDPLMEELSSYRFNCPHQWFDGNNMRDHVAQTLDNIFKNTAAYSASQQPDGKIPDGGGLIWTPNKKMNYFDAIFNELKDRVSAASKDDKDSTNLKKRIIDLLYKYTYYTRGENIFGYASLISGCVSKNIQNFCLLGMTSAPHPYPTTLVPNPRSRRRDGHILVDVLSYRPHDH